MKDDESFEITGGDLRIIIIGLQDERGSCFAKNIYSENNVMLVANGHLTWFDIDGKTGKGWRYIAGNGVNYYGDDDPSRIKGLLYAKDSYDERDNFLRHNELVYKRRSREIPETQKNLTYPSRGDNGAALYTAFPTKWWNEGFSYNKVVRVEKPEDLNFWLQ